MIETTVLAIALMYEWRPSPHAIKSNDVAFMAAVEQSIQLEPNAKPPEPFASDIECLSVGCYEFRNDAYNRLLAASVKNPRWLFWGVNHPDIEVKLWCNKALWALSECHACHGTGFCDFEAQEFEGEPYDCCRKCWQKKIAHESSSPIKCRACEGWKRFWQRGVKWEPSEVVVKPPIIHDENQEENHEGAPWGN